MNEQLTKYAPLFIPFGILLLLAGAISWFVTRQFDGLTNGLLVAGAVLLLGYAVLRPDDIRSFASGRRGRYGFAAFLSSLLVLAIAVLLYYITFQNSEWRIDVTETNEFTPLDETVELLESLDQPVQALVFVDAANVSLRDEASNVLDGLTAISDQLSYEFRDSAAVPGLVDQYDLGPGNWIVLTRGEGEAEVFSKFPIGFAISSDDIHNAILRVLNPRDNTVYFLTGHGEPDIEDVSTAEGLGGIAQFMEAQDVDVEALDLFTETTVPDDATVIVIYGPTVPLSPQELTAIQAFLDAGGSLMYVREPINPEDVQSPDSEGINAILLGDYGIEVRQDLIIDPELAQAGQAETPLIFLSTNLGNSPIVDTDLQELGAVFDTARSVATEPRDDVTHVDLALTSAQSWGESDWLGLAQGQLAPDGADAEGPVSVAVSGDKITTGSRVVVVGDASFGVNGLLGTRGNFLLFSNAINWLIGEEDSISLTPRETIDRNVFIPAQQLSLILLLSFCFPPTLMIVIGGVIWYSRRRRR